MSSVAATIRSPGDRAGRVNTELVRCGHCGDDCSRDAVVTAAGTFCCAGCATVFELIARHGLEHFYVCDVEPGRSQKAAGRLDPDRFAVLDDPAIAARFVLRATTSPRATFTVPAMHCASCLWLLEQLWRFDEGVGRSEVDIAARTVRIDFDPARISVRAIASRLGSLGYEPLLAGESTVAPQPARRRTLYLKIGVAGFAFGNVMLFSVPRYLNGAPLDAGFTTLFGTLNLAFSIPVLLFSAADYFQNAWRSVRARAMSLDVPIAIGLLALFFRSSADILLGVGEGFFDSFAGLTFFLLIGRLFQQMAYERIEFDRTVRSFLPLSVRVVNDGGHRLARIDTLQPGDVVSLRASEVVPSDATLIDDTAHLDYAFVTGESRPVHVRQGEPVHAGGRVVGTSVRLRIERPVSQSELARLWANPAFSASRARSLPAVLARFGLWFTIVALALAAFGAVAWWPDWRMSLSVATAVLIIACPCAFTLSAPIALGTTMGVLGRAGCYLKDPGVALELGRIDTVVFDKTGTLTTSAPETEPVSEGLSSDDWRLVRRLAVESTHPISRAIQQIDRASAADVNEVSGRGLVGWIDGHRVAIGSASFIASETGRSLPEAAGATWAAVDDRVPGWIRTRAAVRPGMDAAVRALSAQYDTRLLSGDHDGDRDRWSPVFDGRVTFRQLPEDKLATVKDLQARGKHVLVIGDGLNDAGALAAADVGLAVTDDTACLVPACDAVISGSRLAHLPELLSYASRARRAIATCFGVSIAYNALGLWLALTGQLTPLATAILMPVSSLTIVALSAGLMRWRLPAVLR